MLTLTIAVSAIGDIGRGPGYGTTLGWLDGFATGRDGVPTWTGNAISQLLSKGKTNRSQEKYTDIIIDGNNYIRYLLT